jgi:predicted membrane-bound mannosyltransferase
LAVTAHLAFQSNRANVTYQSDSRNPYVYAHPTEEIFTLVANVHEYARLTGIGASPDAPLQVAVPGKDYWPLPWYLRDLKHVGWYLDLPPRVGPLIVISDQLEDRLIHRLYAETAREDRRMYLPLLDDPYYIWFRPGVKMQGYVRKDLWDRYQQHPDPNDIVRQTSDQPAQQTTTVPRQQ